MSKSVSVATGVMKRIVLDDVYNLIEVQAAKAQERFDRLDDRINRIDAKVDALSARLDVKVDALSARLDVKVDALSARLDTLSTQVLILAGKPMASTPK